MAAEAMKTVSMLTGAPHGSPAPDAPAARTELERFEQALHALVRRLKAVPGRAGHAGIVPRSGKDLDRAGYVLISQLSIGGPQRVSSLESALGLDVSTVSRELRALEDAGLVGREPDPADRRAVRLVVTVAGAATLESARAARHARLAAAMSCLSDDRRAALVGGLEDLAAALAGDEPAGEDDTTRQCAGDKEQG